MKFIHILINLWDFKSPYNLPSYSSLDSILVSSTGRTVLTPPPPPPPPPHTLIYIGHACSFLRNLVFSSVHWYLYQIWDKTAETSCCFSLIVKFLWYDIWERMQQGFNLPLQWKPWMSIFPSLSFFLSSSLSSYSRIMDLVDLFLEFIPGPRWYNMIASPKSMGTDPSDVHVRYLSMI